MERKKKCQGRLAVPPPKGINEFTSECILHEGKQTVSSTFKSMQCFNSTVWRPCKLRVSIQLPTAVCGNTTVHKGTPPLQIAMLCCFGEHNWSASSLILLILVTLHIFKTGARKHSKQQTMPPIVLLLARCVARFF